MRFPPPPSSLPALAAALSCLVSAACPAASPARPPALLEPYAGHSMILSARGEEVMGPAAAPGVQAMLEADAPHLPEGCTPGDTRVSAYTLSHEIRCDGWTFAVELTLRRQARGQGAAVTARFSISQPEAEPSPCAGPCVPLRGRVLSALADRVRAREGEIALQRVRRRRGASADGWSDALEAARVALATGSPEAARRALAGAVRRRPIGELGAPDAFDLALLARASADDPLEARARERALGLLSEVSAPTAAEAGLRIALRLLARPPPSSIVEALRCARAAGGCDYMPSVRALAASGRYADAAAALDAGPLAPGAPNPGMELLKLRFGLASATRDAQTEIAVARRVMKAWPDSPVGPDLLSSGLLRAGRLREAIELLHGLSRRHPERDIVLGRIAGMVAFLRGAAGADPERRADLQAIEARMRAAAADPKDIVARFLNATRKYYAGDLEGALPELEALRSSGNRDPRIPLYLAMAHFWLGHHARARALIEEAVRAGPSDPDVFYCRSQIARHEDLPLAIADLERYVEMTNRPWALSPEKKDARVKAELDFMRRGLLPPDWDRPGPQRAPFDPEHQQGTPVSKAVRLGEAVTPGVGQRLGPGAGLPAGATGAAGGGPAGGGRPGGEDPDPRLPIAILLALAAAVGVRVWSRRRG